MTDPPAPPTALIRNLVARALAEDAGAGDVTTQAVLPAAAPAIGTIVVEESREIVVAGLAVALEVCRQVDPALTYLSPVSDGERARNGTRILAIKGDGRSMLKAERVALNFLQRLSGIATMTARFCRAVQGYRVRILDTRKTTPGLRMLEKWAVVLGGGANHRLSLADGFLIKDNHLALIAAQAGSTAAADPVARACRLAKERAPHGLKIEVEARTLEEVRGALEGHADIILLDNMEPGLIRRCVELIKGRALVEVSGGITLETVREIAAAGPDLISVGALTHSAPAVNLSMDIRPIRSTRAKKR